MSDNIFRDKKKALSTTYMLTALTAAVVALLCVLSLYAYGLRNSNFYLQNERYTSLNDGWTLSDSYGKVLDEDISLPFKKAIDGDCLVLTRELSQDDGNISSLIFNNQRQAVSVRADGQEIYSINTSGLADYLMVTGLNIVRLPSDSVRQLSYTVYRDSDGFCSADKIYGGGSDLINSYILHYESVTLINLILLTIFSGIILISSVYMLFRHTYDAKLTILLVFSIILMCWAFCDSALYMLTPLSSEAAALISYSLLPFIPAAIIVYTLLMCRGTYRSLRFLLLLDCGVTLLRIILAIGGILRLDETIALGLLYIAFSNAVCLSCTWRDYRSSPGKTSLALFLGFACAMAATVITIIAYTYGIGSLYRAVELTLISVIFVYIAVISIFSNTTARLNHMHDLDRMHLLENAANTDGLTGLSNRMAFDSLLAEIDRSPESYASAVLIMLDLNGLKYNNDTYGHDAGDELIVNAARCIRETVGKDAQCFRIGGDEFTVILHNCPGSVSMRLAEMHRWIDNHNKNAEYKLSIAHGESTLRYLSGGFRSVSDWKQDADINMYNNKNLSALRRMPGTSSGYQNILRYIINSSGDLETCRKHIEQNLGTLYDSDMGRIVLDNWNEMTRILLNGKS